MTFWFLCTENDSLFTPDFEQKFEKELTLNGLGKFFQYPHREHGFVVRSDELQQAYQQRDKTV